MVTHNLNSIIVIKLQLNILLFEQIHLSSNMNKNHKKLTDIRGSMSVKIPILKYSRNSDPLDEAKVTLNNQVED